MALPVIRRLWRFLITPYSPQPTLDSFRARAQTQSSPQAQVTVAVLDAAESERFFGVPLARRGIQPVHLQIENRSNTLMRLQLVRIDANYYTPLEAAGANHFSITKRLSAFGVLGWMFLPLLPLFFFLPLKLITAYRANRRMDALFRDVGFPLRPIAPGGSAQGFVFTPFDAGTKIVHVSLHATGDLLDLADGKAHPGEAADPGVELSFAMSVPGIKADYHRRDFATLFPAGSRVNCDLPTLVRNLCGMPATTSNHKASRSGDPVNLVLIGDFATLLAAFAARWDETETITFSTCWKTARSFLLGSQYRYSPVSALYLFERSQDIALQRTRRSVNDRLHLRLWLTPLEFQGKNVWVGQVSRDIGVRFTTRAWNLTTHRIDPDVDEAHDYVIEDVLQAEHVEAAGYVDGVGPSLISSPRRNLTGDPYITDGKRAVVLLSPERTAPSFVSWS